MSSVNEFPNTNTGDCVLTASVETHAISRPGKLPKGSLFPPPAIM